MIIQKYQWYPTVCNKSNKAALKLSRNDLARSLREFRKEFKDWSDQGTNIQYGICLGKQTALTSASADITNMKYFK